MPTPLPTDYYRVVTEPGEAETRVKGSRFIGRALPAQSEQTASAVIDRIRKTEHDATHHCSAWRVGADAAIWRAHDDGEPSGSAGLPILRQIEAADLTDTVVVVTRYYGGTKLGTGGLVRAYGDAARLCLQAARSTQKLIAIRLRLTFDYPDTSAAMHAIERFGATTSNSDYGARTVLDVDVARSLAESFEKAAIDATAGRIVVEVVE